MFQLRMLKDGVYLSNFYAGCFERKSNGKKMVYLYIIENRKRIFEVFISCRNASSRAC